MTLDELLGYSTDDLEKWLQQSPEKIQELFGHYFQYTRPEYAVAEHKPTTKERNVKAPKLSKNAQMKVELIELMKQSGVTIPTTTKI